MRSSRCNPASILFWRVLYSSGLTLVQQERSIAEKCLRWRSKKYRCRMRNPVLPQISYPESKKSAGLYLILRYVTIMSKHVIPQTVDDCFSDAMEC